MLTLDLCSQQTSCAVIVPQLATPTTVMLITYVFIQYTVGDLAHLIFDNFTI